MPLGLHRRPCVLVRIRGTRASQTRQTRFGTFFAPSKSNVLSQDWVAVIKQLIMVGEGLTT